MRTRALLIIGGWLVLLVAISPWVSGFNDVKSYKATDYLPGSAEATEVERIAETLPGGSENVFWVVYERDGAITDADRQAAQRQYQSLNERYGVSARPAAEAITVSDDDKALLYAVPVSVSFGKPSEYIDEFRDVVADTPPGLAVSVTGPGAMSADFDGAFEGVDEQLLLATLLVVTVLLLLIYRSPALWLIPLISVAMAYVFSMGVVYLLVKAFDITVNDQSAAILLILVFGVGTDYALLIVARYREELRREENVGTAMIAALRGAGPAIAGSAATVALGLLCLIAADMNNTAGMGPVGAAGVVCTLLAMLTVFPAILVLFGRSIFWPRIPKVGVIESDKASRSGLWVRIGDTVARRPAWAVAASLVILGVLALGLLAQTRPLTQAERFVDTPEAVTGQSVVAEHFPKMGGSFLTIITPTPSRPEVLRAVTGDPGIALAMEGRTGPDFAEITAFSVDPADSDGDHATIERLRENLPGVAEGTVVGGPSAAMLDTADAASRDERVVIPLVLVVVTLILIVLLRSLVAPIALVLTVVVSFGSAMGASIWVFEHVFGFAGLEPVFPVLAFLFLVALGVDYNIFLMTRAKEEAHRVGTRAGMRLSLAVTGGVITSAGVVLAATFSILMTMPLVALVQLGFAVALGVLIDTLLVRSVLVPALTLLVGEPIWWPNKMTPGGADRTDPDSPRLGSPGKGGDDFVEA
ncbi:MMPL family transporter [Nocardia takedensis]|uniref:MMPL family transporter n=1 Tax=Nocardia takedensis TaxID=259390 RepID=UPI00031315B1|nr:MMPL family transporter [Nocardia takedensis]